MLETLSHKKSQRPPPCPSPPLFPLPSHPHLSAFSNKELIELGKKSYLAPSHANPRSPCGLNYIKNTQFSSPRAVLGRCTEIRIPIDMPCKSKLEFLSWYFLRPEKLDSSFPPELANNYRYYACINLDPLINFLSDITLRATTHLTSSSTTLLSHSWPLFASRRCVKVDRNKTRKGKIVGNLKGSISTLMPRQREHSAFNVNV